MTVVPIDYRDLLRRYMAHIIGWESISFLGKIDPPPRGTDFTEEEIAELKRIEREIDEA